MEGKNNLYSIPEKTISWLASKQKKDGTWRGGSPYKSRSHPFLTAPDTTQPLGNAAHALCPVCRKPADG